MEHFMDRNVVMVSFNYRLGVLGGLYLDREVVSGNQGMWDQVLALTWVRDNIEHFGGDKDRVTIFGESAGGMSVVNLVLSPACQVREGETQFVVNSNLIAGPVLCCHLHEWNTFPRLREVRQTSQILRRQADRETRRGSQGSTC